LQDANLGNLEVTKYFFIVFIKLVETDSINRKKGVYQKSTTSPLTVVRGTPPLKGGESNVLIIKCFPSFSRRGVMPEGS
jgi:hypothetical protein